MTGFEKFVHFFQGKMNTPTILGWYHLLCFGIMLLACILIIIFRKKISQKAVRFIVLGIGILLVVLEIIKQLEYSFSWDESSQTASWSYQWYAFPFQFCSTPMYLMVLAGSLPNCKVRDAIYSYLGTFALFAGLCVMCYPGDVFTSTIFINIQTMVWHGSMVVVGILLLSTQAFAIEHKSILKAGIVFLIMLLTALLMDCIWAWAGGLQTGQTFNMFYISPYYPCTLPIFDIIYSSTHYILFFLVYVIGFILSAYIFLLVAIGIKKLYVKIQEKRNINKALM